jgi:hypothetical protein
VCGGSNSCGVRGGEEEEDTGRTTNDKWQMQIKLAIRTICFLLPFQFREVSQSLWGLTNVCLPMQHKMCSMLLFVISFVCGECFFAKAETYCYEKTRLIGSDEIDTYKLVVAKFLQTVKLECHFW